MGLLFQGNPGTSKYSILSETLPCAFITSRPTEAYLSGLLCGVFLVLRLLRLIFNDNCTSFFHVIGDPTSIVCVSVVF